MIRLKTLHELKRMPPNADIVYVQSVKKLFRCHDGEWIERAYYTTKEIAVILGINHRRIQHVLKKMNLQPMAGASKSLSYHQLIILARVYRIKKEHPKMMYREIKKMLGL